MYVYMYLYVYVYMFVCVYMYVFIYVCMYVYVLCIYVCIIYACMYILCMYIMYVYTFVCLILLPVTLLSFRTSYLYIRFPKASFCRYCFILIRGIVYNHYANCPRLSIRIFQHPKWKTLNPTKSDRKWSSLSPAQHPKSGLGHTMFKVSRSHTITHTHTHTL
jgi:hypothetical protein